MPRLGILDHDILISFQRRCRWQWTNWKLGGMLPPEPPQSPSSGDLKTLSAPLQTARHWMGDLDAVVTGGHGSIPQLQLAIDSHV